MVPGSRVIRKMSASGLSSRSGRMPWLAVMAAMRERPRSGQTTPEPTSRKCGATSRRSTCSSVSLVSAKTIQSGRVPDFARLDGDAPDDAVAPRRRRDLDARRRRSDSARSPASGRWPWRQGRRARPRPPDRLSRTAPGARAPARSAAMARRTIRNASVSRPEACRTAGQLVSVVKLEGKATTSARFWSAGEFVGERAG